MDAKIFGTFIAKQRKVKKMTQAELATKLNVTDKAVSRWERGIGLPDVGTIEPLAQALDVSLPEIMHARQTEEPSICVLDSFFKGLKAIPKEEVLESLPAKMRAHVKNGGSLYILDGCQGTELAVSMSEDSGDNARLFLENTYVEIPPPYDSNMFRGISTVTNEAICRHRNSGGTVYLEKLTEYGRVVLHTSLDPKADSIECAYYMFNDRIDGSYADIAGAMKDCVDDIIQAHKFPAGVTRMNAYILRRYLEYCLEEEDLNELTEIFRDKKDDNVLGFYPPDVAKFVTKMANMYPKETRIYNRYREYRNRVYAEIGALMDECLETMAVSCDLNEKNGRLSYSEAQELADAEDLLRKCLDKCLTLEGTRLLKYIYKDKRADNELGYEVEAVCDFVEKLIEKYPMPQ